MPTPTLRVRLLVASLALFAPALLSCGEAPIGLAPRAHTWAELRVVRRAISVTPPGENERAPYPRERLVDGEVVTITEGGLGWLRRDGGATLLVRGPAKLRLRGESIELDEGRAFVDTREPGTTALDTPAGRLLLTQVRASIDAHAQGPTEAYVLSGEVRSGSRGRAIAGEILRIEGGGKGGEPKASTAPALTWDDWTGGLATTDRAAEPAPYGVGTIGARTPGEQGVPRFPLAIHRLDVRVSIDQDFAVTEVDETFFNPSSDTVEGIYRFRTPEGATLHRFGVDREGVVVWGRVKEKQAAAAQYQANVYQGSKEDPALLEWDAPGVYRARLYPIGPGESRRVVVRYAEWLGRSGAKGERRLYTYPMAAEGAEGSLPVIEELSIDVDLQKAAATEVRSGMTGVREGERVMIREHDLVPRADFALELFDGGASGPAGFRAPHEPALDTLPPSERAEALRRARDQADYLLVRLRPGDIPAGKGGLDLAVVIDTSAATDPASLGVARAATEALLAHLGGDDRAAIWAGDTSLRPVLPDRRGFSPVDPAARRAILAGLASIDRGGATDLGAMLAEAAASLDPARRGAVVYIGDGASTVGETTLGDLRARLSKLPRPVRIFGLGVGDGADMAILEGLSRGAFAERIGDGNAAARAALRLLEEAERPALLGASVDLGAGVERIYPRDLGAIVEGESLLLVGRISGTASPTSITVTGPGGAPITQPLTVRAIDDRGDLSQRWAEGRLAQLLDEGAGRSALVDLGMRHGIVTPFTSFYVPTKNEMSSEEKAELEQAKERLRAQRLAGDDARSGKEGRRVTEDERSAEIARLRQEVASQKAKADKLTAELASEKDEETRADLQKQLEKVQRETQVLRAPAARPVTATNKPVDANKKSAPGDPLAGDLDGAPAVAAAPSASPADRAKSLQEATEFGMIGLLNSGAGGDPNAPTAPWGRDDSLGNDPMSARGNMWGNDVGDSFGAGGLGLSGIGEGGGGRGDGNGIGLGSIGTIGHGAGTGTGQGFGSGHGRLGGAHRTSPPQVKMGKLAVSGRLPPEVLQRITRQNFGRFRLCYENGLRNNPNLMGRVQVRYVIGRDGSLVQVQNGGSDMPDSAVVACVVRGFYGLSFPMPEDRGLVTATQNLLFAPDGDAKISDEIPKVAAAPKELKEEKPREKAPEKAKQAPVDKARITVQIAEIPHEARRCGPAASVSFEERIILWRERLSRAPNDAAAAAEVYHRALAACEIPTWRERARLLSMMLDALPDIERKVALWRSMFDEGIAADLLYKGILSRVRTADDLRKLHAALGLRSMDAGLLAKAIKDAASPGDRVTVLRKHARTFPDDFTLAMRLLDALEDAGDDEGARSLGRTLRARPDADAALRTAVGELSLRLAARDKDPAQKALDEAEARRAFGEIVEFAPDDPVARRRLGDLLRAHGWFTEASRQYETLAHLAPDDAQVSLLLAAASEGRGLLEAAVKGTEIAGAAGSPSDILSPAVTARAFAASWLAWGLLDAQAGNRASEAQTLAARLLRVTAPERHPRGTRVILTWSHPELHPTLWSNALGAPMPAPEGDLTLGLAQVHLPLRDGLRVEVRVEPDELPHAIRLGATAVLTAITGEGEPSVKAQKLSIPFTRDADKVRRFVTEGGALREESP
ncbi:MAG: VIT domain-containing protein [Byssovorax sp.]